MLKLYFSNPTITPRTPQGLSALTTGHPPLQQAPTSGLSAILANFKGIIKEESGSGETINHVMFLSILTGSLRGRNCKNGFKATVSSILQLSSRMQETAFLTDLRASISDFKNGRKVSSRQRSHREKRLSGLTAALSLIINNKDVVILDCALTGIPVC